MFILFAINEQNTYVNAMEGLYARHFACRKFWHLPCDFVMITVQIYTQTDIFIRINYLKSDKKCARFKTFLFK